MIRISMICALVLSAAFAAAQDGASTLRMNHIQVVATHNSYHVKPDEPLFSQVKQAYPDAAAWDYTHAPLDVQLARGVRGFELDVYYDPAGTKVLHVPQFDANTTCPAFVECLTVVRDWSKANARHVPIIILVELKDEQYEMVRTPILPFDADALDQLDEEIRSVFEAEQLLTPDSLRAEGKSLAETITQDGWPLLDDARGKVMFVLHARGLHAELYLLNRPNLEGRAMVLESVEGAPWASVFIRNNPRDESIPRLVNEGYIVRTRADSDLRQAAANDTARRDAAFASGAHLVTTDFPPGQPHAETGYIVALPDGAAAICNPVNAPDGCAGTSIE